MEKIISKKLLIISIVLLIFLILIGFLVFRNFNKKEISNINNNYSTYIPFGDSFTIGLGVIKSHRWPNIMVDNFAKEGINIKILDNPAVSGYTIRDMINYELPILNTFRPDFITIFIGTNDSFANLDIKFFEDDYKEMLDKIQRLLINPKKIILITIPDYSKFPLLNRHEDNDLSDSISAYNKIIKKEAASRDLILVDLFPLSQKMTDEKYFISDGLHPSKTGYMKWERVIYPKVKELLFN